MLNFTSDDVTANGYLALPEQENAPAVLVLHAWWGLTDFFKALCDRLAAAGFVAFAPDLFGNGQTADTIDGAEQLIEAESYEDVVAIVQSAVDFLHNHPATNSKALGMIGFSFGAAYALVAATHLKPKDVAAVVVFYGNYPDLDASDYTNASAAFLGHFAEADPYESLDDMRNTKAEMEKAGREATFHVYEGTGHWFFESNRPDAYAADAAQLAWERTLSFLRRSLNVRV